MMSTNYTRGGTTQKASEPPRFSQAKANTRARSACLDTRVLACVKEYIVMYVLFSSVLESRADKKVKS